MRLTEIYDRLYAAYGPQKWWPGETPFEVLVGAVLVQNTAWRNVERALAILREQGLMTPRKLYALAPEDLAEYIRSAGYFRLKAQRLRNLLKLIVERYDGSLAALFDQDVESLRRELLTVNGIGPETADSIVLYAAGLPSFVVDTYTHRILSRHGWMEPEADYHQLKEHFESQLPVDVPLYNEFHALLVRVGHHHCSKTPNCEGCPLAELLPPGGPLM
ncbi:MAG: endonuclease III domain-containing protein [Pirellulales bacterium]